MAFRGRGRGRGFGGRGGGFGFGYAKQEPFELFPEIELPDGKAISTDPELVASYFKFEKFWRNSPYYLGDGVSKKENESVDIERFSDWSKPKRKSKSKRGSFYDFLVLRPDNFPKELLGDFRRERSVKKARWSQALDMLKLDIFEKLEEKNKNAGEKEEEDEEQEDESEEDDGEYSDEGDYEQGEYVDDDEDDYNPPEEDNDEPTYGDD